MSATPDQIRRAATARRAQLENAAHRRADNPTHRASAARVVRAALKAGHLTADDLKGDVVQASDLGSAGGAA